MRVSIGWQLGDVYHEQIGLCHDEKIFSTIWSNYTLHGASIDFRLYQTQKNATLIRLIFFSILGTRILVDQNSGAMDCEISIILILVL